MWAVWRRGSFNIVQEPTFEDVVAVAGDLLVPIATVQAIINGLTFAVQGTGAPHWQYGPFVPRVAEHIANVASEFV